MDYRVRTFDGVTFERTLLTGSAVYGAGFPKDVDYLIDLNDTEVAVDELINLHGWEDCALKLEDYPTEAFQALRKDHVNLIFAKTNFFRSAFEQAHHFLMSYPQWGREKADRISVFQHFRGVGETDWKLAAFIKAEEMMAAANSNPFADDLKF